MCLVMEHGKYVLRLSKVVRNVRPGPSRCLSCTCLHVCCSGAARGFTLTPRAADIVFPFRCVHR